VKFPGVLGNFPSDEADSARSAHDAFGVCLALRAHVSVRVLFLSAMAGACNEAVLTPAPDAGLDACTSIAIPFCDASATGCVGSDSSDPWVALFPRDAAYPVGCMANVIGTSRDPITNECKLAAACTCVADGSPEWVCSP
jgi:hypothetical protein